MSRPSRFLLAAAALVAFFAAGATSAQQQRFYDPPGRVARISDMRGYLSYSPAGDGDWYDAHRNRPLVRGDALWSDRGARAELQAGSTWIRMDQDTSVKFTQIDDRMLQLEVAEGTVNVRVRRLYPGQRVEIDTPNVAFVIDRPGTFRLDVDRNSDNTTIEARQGGGRVYGVGGRFDVRYGDVVVFYGEDVRDYELYAFPGQDNFDRYVRQRDQRIERSISSRYLGDDLVGYSDLDDYGRWQSNPSYGNVWYPSNTYAGWAPYQDGQWVWQDPWGWTWVDDQPWGFAPSHYGRWAWVDGRWGWVPGPRTYRPIYSPALVGFMQLANNSIGWFPLGPSDVYYPTYNVSQNYFRAVNVANTNVSATTVNSGYTRYGRANVIPLAQGNYRNRTVPTAVTAVSQDVFTNSRPVRQARRDARELAAATAPTPAAGRGPELRRSLSMRPDRASIRGAAAQARVRPPQAVADEQVIVHTAPPAATPTPAATDTPAPVAPVRERPRRVRQIDDAQAATDARARGPRHQGESAAAATPPAEPAAATPTTAKAADGGRLQALDRDALAKERADRRAARQQQHDAPVAPAPSANATAPTPAAAPAPVPAPTSAVKEQEDARAAQRKAREEQRQAMEAQRAAQQQQAESERALQEAQKQREQAKADAGASQQKEAADAEAKAVAERQQAREAQREAARQQREAQQAQREAQQQQAEAAQAKPEPKPAESKPAETAPPAATTAPEARKPRAEGPGCVTQERIDAMRKRGVPEERIAELKLCPVAEQPQQ